MIRVPKGLWRRFDQRLELEGVPRGERGQFRKWLRFYLDFCHKYEHGYGAAESLPPFLEKLASKGQSAEQRAQASAAVNLYFRMLADKDDIGGDQAEFVEEQPKKSSRNERHRRDANSSPAPATKRPSKGASWKAHYRAMRDQIQMRNYSPKTLSTYTQWTRKFQAFTRSKPPEELDTGDVKAFLTDLAVRQNVAASTQNQAFNALLFFYRNGLGKEFGKVEGVVRAKRRRYIPVVLSRSEVDAVIAHLKTPYGLPVKLLYGCGLRISECLKLRVHCFNLENTMLTVHDGKGQKDRTVPLPAAIMAELREHLDELRELHERDMETEDFAGVFLPKQYEKKAKNAAKAFIWQWFFPAPRLTRVSKTDEMRRWHMQQSHLHRAIKQAAAKAKLTKRVTAHTFRHSFASHLLQANYDIVTIQRLLGHSDVKTTMIYTQTVPSVTLKDAKSPLDLDS